MACEWLAPTGFLVALASLYLALRPRTWVESLFLAVASVFITLWGLHDALYCGAPSFYQCVAAAALILDGLSVVVAVLTGLALRKVGATRGVP